MILLDTGFCLAIAQPNDQLHFRATAWAKEIVDPLVLTEYVIWETVNALSDPKDRPKAHQFIHYIRSSKNCTIVPASQELFEAGLRFHGDRKD